MSIASLTSTERIGLFTMRRVRALAGADQLRLLGSALLLFLLIDFLRLALVAPAGQRGAPLMTVMDAVAYVSLIVALWRPRAGVALAALPLATALFWTSSSLESLLLVAAPALGIAQVTRRAALGATAGFVGYVIVRIIVYTGPEPLPHALILVVPLAVGLAVGWVALAVRERRESAEHRAAHLASENLRIRADERRTLSRELHDVVAHQLSTASLQIMGARDSTDPAVLSRVLATVDRATTEALTELRLLVRVLRDDPTTSASGTEIRELAERIPPTQSAAAAELTLLEHGFEPDVNVPAAADGLAMTVQRTMSRVIMEAAGNVIRHAPPKSRCVVRTVVGQHQVTLEIRNPVPEGTEVPALGWGLRGLRERIELTGGTFSVRAAGDEWVVAVTIPLE